MGLYYQRIFLNIYPYYNYLFADDLKSVNKSKAPAAHYVPGLKGFYLSGNSHGQVHMGVWQHQMELKTTLEGQINHKTI